MNWPNRLPSPSRSHYKYLSPHLASTIAHHRGTEPQQAHTSGCRRGGTARYAAAPPRENGPQSAAGPPASILAGRSGNAAWPAHPPHICILREDISPSRWGSSPQSPACPPPPATSGQRRHLRPPRSSPLPIPPTALLGRSDPLLRCIDPAAGTSSTGAVWAEAPRGSAVAGFIRENPSEPRLRAASRDSGRIRGGAEWSQAPSDAKLESEGRPSGALAAALRAQDDAGKERWGAAMLASLVASTSLAGACG
jgi:hypothetical protein